MAKKGLVSETLTEWKGILKDQRKRYDDAKRQWDAVHKIERFGEKVDVGMRFQSQSLMYKRIKCMVDKLVELKGRGQKTIADTRLDRIFKKCLKIRDWRVE